MSVQLPCTARPWLMTDMFLLAPGTSAKVYPPKMCSRCSRLGRRPKGAADEGVDAVGADQDVVRGRGAVGEVQDHHALVLRRSSPPLAEPDARRRDRGEHPRVQLGPQQADEAAAVGLLDVGVDLDPTRTRPLMLRNSLSVGAPKSLMSTPIARSAFSGGGQRLSMLPAGRASR